jgi:hypothetical protein
MEQDKPTTYVYRGTSEKLFTDAQLSALGKFVTPPRATRPLCGRAIFYL